MIHDIIMNQREIMHQFKTGSKRESFLGITRDAFTGNYGKKRSDSFSTSKRQMA
jgi:hypothetical protein